MEPLKPFIRRSLKPNRFIPVWLFLSILISILLYSCISAPQKWLDAKEAKVSFSSNGERIYFTASSDRGTNLTYTGGAPFNGMMGNGSRGGMMGRNMQGGMMGLTCAVCHGLDGRGGVHMMAGMQTMNAPDIRWSTLKDEFDAEKFRLAVTQGQDPDGTKQLSKNMPRWNIGKEDLADLIDYLKTL